MKSSTSILGILGGVAVGAALGILFAPDKGSKTRQKIKDRAIESKDALEENVNDLLDTLKDKYSTMKSKSENLIDGGREILNDEVKSFKNAVK